MSYKLQDLIDIGQFQYLQDRLNEIYPFPSAIIDNQGNILTATAWQDVCTKFHRLNIDCERDCVVSDQYIRNHLHEANPAVSYRCPRGLVDNAIPIIIGGIHYGNFFTGQFFLEKPDLEFFRAQAKKFGFNEAAYLEAVRQVPVWSEEQLHSYLLFINGLIHFISDSGLKKLKEIEARERIEESEERADTILRQMNDGFWITNSQGGQIIEVNEAMCRMLGYTRDELLKMSVADVDADDTPQDVEKTIQRVIQAGSAQFESRFRRKDGTILDVEISLTYVPNRNIFFGFHRDISERKRSQKALQESEGQYRSLFEYSNDAIFIHDEQGHMLDVNQQAVEMLGYTYEELIALPTIDYHPKESVEEAKAAFKEAVKDGHVRFDSKFRRKDGSVIDVALSVRRIEHGITVYQALVRDITERKRAERTMQESEAHYRTLVEGIPGIIYSVSNRRGGVYYSSHVTDLLGYSPEQLIAQPQLWKNSIHADDLLRVEKAIHDAVGGKPFRIEYRIRDTRGSWHWFDDRSLGYQADGAEIFVEGLALDITERKQAEEAARESNELFTQFIRHSPIYTYIKEVSLTRSEVLYASDNFDEMIGISGRDLVGRTNVEMFPKEFAEKITADDWAVVSSGEVIKLDEVLNNRSYTTIKFPIRMGNRSLLAGYTIDITERNQAGKALSISEKRFRALFEQAAVGVGLVDTKTGHYIDINQKCCEIFGYTKAEMLGHTFMDITHPDDIQENLDKNDLLMAGEISEYSIEKRYVRKDGSIVWANLTVSPSWAPGEAPEDYLNIAVVQDITERKVAEKTLKESENKLRAITDSAHEAILMMDVKGRVSYWNPAAERILGYKAREAIGQTLHDMITPEAYRGAHAAAFPAFQKTGQGKAIGKSQEMEALRKDGSSISIQLSLSSLYLNGEWNAVGIISDITERKLAVTALKESEERYRLLFHSMESGFALHEIICDAQGVPCDYRFLEINPAFEKLTGLKAEDLVGKTALEVLPNTEKEWIERYGRVALSGVADHFENFSSELGKYYEVSAYSPRRGRFATFIQDVTERTLLTEKIIQSQKLADLGTLAAGVAHEVNTPLQIITGSSGRLLEKLESAEVDLAAVKTRLERIDQSAWHIARIVHALLIYARNSNDQFITASLNDLVRDALLLTEHQIHVWSNIEVVTELADDLPAFLCDRNKVIQALINLLNNARDAMPNGGTLTIRTGFDSQAQKLTLTVVDTGEGIPEAIHSKIFDPFFTTKPLGEGTGLGLSIVLGIVQSHGGDIKVESQPGQGSTFVLKFALTPPLDAQKQPDNGRFHEN